MIWLIFAVQAYATTLVQGIPTSLNSLDPYTIAGIDAYVVTGNMLEPLARSNPRTGEFEKVLADSWELDPPKKTFRVKLKKGIPFHDGSELTAEDVRFTFESYFKPEYRADLWRGMWSEIESVRVKERYVAEFKMKGWHYQAFEAALTSMRILPRTFYGEVNHEKFRTGLVGTGPFRLKKVGRSLEMIPFAEYHGQVPTFDLTVKPVSDAKLASEMIGRGELDFYSGRGAHERAFESGLGEGFWLDLNMDRPLFRRPETREVLTMVWRRSELNQKVFGGQMKPAIDVFSPQTDFYPKGEAQTFAPQLARQKLQAAGWKDRDQDGVLEREILKFEFTVIVKTPEQERWCTLLQNDAKEAGIRLHIQRVEDENQWLKRLEEGRYDAAARDGGLINEVTNLAWHSKAPYNYQKFSDVQIDRLTEKLDREFNLKERRALFRKAILRLRELHPQVPGLYSNSEHYLISDRLQPNPQNPAQAWLWSTH